MTVLSSYVAGTLLSASSAAAVTGGIGVIRPNAWPQGAGQQLEEDTRTRPAWRRMAAGPIDAGTVPLVLLHAFPFDSAMFEAVVTRLSTLPVLLVDLPGQGMSRFVQPCSMVAAAAAVASTVRSLGIKRAVVAGVSMGGYVTMAMLRYQPELMAGAILINTRASADDAVLRSNRLVVAEEAMEAGSSEPVMPMVDRMISPASNLGNPALAEQLRRWARRTTPEGVAWAQQAMLGRAASYETLRVTGLPVHVLAGAEDSLIPMAMTDAMVEAIGRHGHFTLINGAGHLCPVENPGVTGGLIREAYRRMTGA